MWQVFHLDVVKKVDRVSHMLQRDLPVTAAGRVHAREKRRGMEAWTRAVPSA
jgi:hypothetical protein